MTGYSWIIFKFTTGKNAPKLMFWAWPWLPKPENAKKVIFPSLANAAPNRKGFLFWDLERQFWSEKWCMGSGHRIDYAKFWFEGCATLQVNHFWLFLAFPLFGKVVCVMCCKVIRLKPFKLGSRKYWKIAKNPKSA